MLRIRDLLEEYFDLYLLPMILVAAWFYYPYCQRGPVLCLAQLFLHRHCPGCGLTRAICFLVHGRLKESIHLNPLSLIVVALMAINFSTALWSWRREGSAGQAHEYI
jgi:hypothetical protein